MALEFLGCAVLVWFLARVVWDSVTRGTTAEGVAVPVVFLAIAGEAVRCGMEIKGLGKNMEWGQLTWDAREGVKTGWKLHGQVSL